MNKIYFKPKSIIISKIFFKTFFKIIKYKIKLFNLKKEFILVF